MSLLQPRPVQIKSETSGTCRQQHRVLITKVCVLVAVTTDYVDEDEEESDDDERPVSKAKGKGRGCTRLYCFALMRYGTACC